MKNEIQHSGSEETKLFRESSTLGNCLRCRWLDRGRTAALAIAYAWGLSLAFAVTSPASLHGQDVDVVSRGVVVLASKSGAVGILEGEEFAPDARYPAGSIMAEGGAVRIGPGGSAVLLFSNGTVATVEEQSLLRIVEFAQEPFLAEGRTVSELESEPSVSNLKLELEFGSVVVATKKMDRQSRIDLRTPSGVAEIFGTQFRLQETVGQGVKLDVTESTVSFRPVTGGPPLRVGTGRGLDVLAGRALTRPVDPAAAQSIGALNATALRTVSAVSLTGIAEAARTETAVAVKEIEAKRRQIEERKQRRENAGQPAIEESSGRGPREKAPASDRVSSPRKGKTLAQVRKSPASAKLEASGLMEHNHETRQARRLDQVVARSKDLGRLSLSDSEARLFLQQSGAEQSVLLRHDRASIIRLLGLAAKGSSTAQLSTFCGYSDNTREKLLRIAKDETLVSILVKGYAESWVAGILSDTSLSVVNATTQPTATPASDAYLSLSAELKDSGNDFILDQLLLLGSGSLTSELLAQGSIANRIYSGFTSAGTLNTSSLVSQTDALANQLYADVSSLHVHLKTDGLATGSNGSFLGGRTVTLAATTHNLDSFGTGVGDPLYLTASEKLSLSSGTTDFTSTASKPARIVLMSGADLEIAKGTTLKAATADLVVAARRGLSLDQVQLIANQEIAVRSLADLHLAGGSAEASQLLTLKAAKELYVDGLALGQNLPKIVMEATTIRLSNINFPTNAAVNLNSLKGPLDGRYPNFGLNTSAADQYGRVNFLSNVKAGGNLIGDRAAFDQFGKNIVIGKMVTP